MSLSLQKWNLFSGAPVQEVEKFLKDNPAWDVNEDFGDDWTALHFACIYGHHEVASLLLVHPAINVNQKSISGSSPFFIASSNGHVETVKVLLQDSRVEINMPANNGCTPVWSASHWGNGGVIKWMIASGRELDLDRKGKVGGKEYTPIETARAENRTSLASLLERFKGDPTGTRREIRVELGVTDALAAELFATTVFLCDDFLRIRGPKSDSEVGRFFRIASLLPMELQMVLCHRVYDSTKENISSKDAEPAFKHLASLYEREQSSPSFCLIC